MNTMEAIKDLPNYFYYIDNFVTPEEEEELLQRINSAPKPKWVELKNRRLQNWGGVVHKDKVLLCSEQIPAWLSKVIDKVAPLHEDLLNNRPNHVLINEYLPGQGILPHTDGPAYKPIVATVSLGSHTVLNIYDKTESTRPIKKILLHPRSLLITKDEAYSEYLHGIEELHEDTIDSTVANSRMNEGDAPIQLPRVTRVSLTIRHVSKVVRFGAASKTT